ncbi:hypothetical protein PCE1_002695 [Barthelona sp. PCE]
MHPISANALSGALSVTTPLLVHNITETHKRNNNGLRIFKSFNMPKVDWVDPLVAGAVTGTKISTSKMLGPKIHKRLSNTVLGNRFLISGITGTIADASVSTLLYPVFAAKSKLLHEPEYATNWITTMAKMAATNPTECFQGIGKHMLVALPHTFVRAGAYSCLESFLLDKLVADRKNISNAERIVIAAVAAVGASVAATLITKPLATCIEAQGYVHQEVGLRIPFLNVLIEYLKYMILQPMSTIREILPFLEKNGFFAFIQGGLYEAALIATGN